MRVLVTGGAGYVGSHAARALSRAGHEVWVYDSLIRGHAAAALPGRLEVGDLNDTLRLIDILRGRRIEAVLHFAAYTQVGESVTDPTPYYKNNVLGSLSLLEAMRAAGVWRIVFSSTTATYGVPTRMPIDEDQPQQPINPYGFTKLAVERILGDFAHAYGIGYAALRYFNAAGASPDGDLGEDHRPESHLIPLVLQVALGQREKLSLFGDDYPTPDGTCVRDYVHVDDLASAHLLALEKLVPGQGLHLNLGTGRGYSVLEVVAASQLVTGHAIPLVRAPRRAGDAPTLIADSSRARRVLGWEPKYSDLESIVSTAWNWHKHHPQGYATPKNGTVVDFGSPTPLATPSVPVVDAGWGNLTSFT